MSYSIINTIILQREAADSAAEVHGIAAAMLCLDPNAEAGTWLAEAIAKEAELWEDDKLTLVDLFEQSKDLMASDEFVFDLFLPEDDAPISERCAALMQWCQGYLFGMGRVETSSKWPGEIDEILKDIVEFTKLDTDIDEEDAEEVEADLVEIQEYLRAAVMLVRSELNNNAVSSDTVH